jgi:hypothetical protein
MQGTMRAAARKQVAAQQNRFLFCGIAGPFSALEK